MHGFACGSQQNDAGDAGAGEEEGVGGLGVVVDCWLGGGEGGGGGAGEEGGGGDPDAFGGGGWGGRAGHGCGLKGMVVCVCIR